MYDVNYKLIITFYLFVSRILLIYSSINFLSEFSMSSTTKERYEKCRSECEDLRKKIDSLRGDEDEKRS